MQDQLIFSITDIQTDVFPLPSTFLTLERNRRFIVSVTDGKITKTTRAAPLDLQSLRWTENLGDFTVDSSSQVTLRVFERQSIFNNSLLGTFLIPYEVLRLSRNTIVQWVDDSKNTKTASRKISVTWSECRIISAELDTRNAEEMRSLIQSTKQEALKMNTSDLAVEIVGVSNNVGEGLDTAFKAAASVQDFFAKCKIVSDQLGFVVRAVDKIAEVHPYAQMAWSVVSFIPKKISGQIQLDQNIMGLLDAMIDVLDLGSDANELAARCQRSKNHEKTFIRLLEQINECSHFIQSYAVNDSFWKRLMKNIAGDGKSIVDNYRQTLEQLRDNFLREVIVTIEINVFRILAEVKEVKEDIKAIDLDMKLRELPYGEGTEFDSNKRCLPQTRLKFLDAIVEWINDPDPSSPKVLALLGQAGTGKSAIAHEVAHRYDCINRLTTSYFFVRGNSSGREPYRFFMTLARDLCRICPAFKAALGRVINEKPELPHLRNYTMLVESLLRVPVKDLYFVGPIVVVIDALDENEDATPGDLYASGNSIPFHTALLQCVSELPSNFRILITSRPEENLLDAFPESSSVRRIHMDDQQLSKETDNDIRIYMNTQLSKAGVGEGDLQELVRKAEGLFQWAFVTCDYIARPPRGLNSKRCIQRVLNPPTDIKTVLNRLDVLYSTVLQRFDMKDPDVRNNFQSAMRQILGSFEPLSVDALNRMQFNSSTDDPRDISDIVKGLGSLLSHVTSPESALPVAPLHTSFRDFLTNKTRSGDFYVDLDNAPAEFALATLRTMQKDLKFNICKLESSDLLNTEVPDLKKHVEDAISSALAYSCRFWDDHLACVSKFNSDVFESLLVFMKERFLFWLEVLSVRGEVAVAKPALSSLQGWLSDMRDQVDIGEIDGLVKDAITFVGYFGYPIAQSAPHIYLSALPFSPSSSAISKLYMSRFSTLQFERGRLTEWPALEMTMPVPNKSMVRCVAWSRDDDFIAAGVRQHVYVWSTSTGMLACEPFYVESECTASMTFSYNGKLLAIGLYGKGVCILDVMEGKETRLQEPWMKGVSAVAFSDDGRQLVLGLHDFKVWVWDLEKAALVGEPFVGHNNPVWAVSFLDREHILSRSGFRTVRVWNVKTRARVTRMDVPTGTIGTTIHHSEQFRRDDSRVESSFGVCSWTEAAEGEEQQHRETMEGWRGGWGPAAAFSPDGKLVATCSPTHVHIWFAEGNMAGNLAGGPFSNEGGICIAFSAGGRRIASGTATGTLRVWKVQPVDEDKPSNGRMPWSLAFMLDGAQIGVGWSGGRVSMLDASTGEEVAKIMEGDDRDDRAFITVSPNGERIASARGKEMYIWTRTGQAVAGPLKSRDNELITSVAFSADSNDLVAYGTLRGTVCVLNASTGVLIAAPQKFKSIVTRLALASITNGSTMRKARVAVGVRDEMFIWDMLSVAGPFAHGVNAEICALAFSSDGKYITSAAEDYTLRVWNSLDGKVARGPITFRDRRKSIFADNGNRQIAVAADGRRVAFNGMNDTILLFDVVYKGDSEVVLHSSLVLAGHLQNVLSLAFSRDGKYLATTSADRTIKIWDLNAAFEHSCSDSGISNLDETWIDRDGWAACVNRDGGDSPLRRVIWVPEIHRDGLYRPSNTCLIGGQKETRLNLKNFVQGKKWVKCGLEYN